MNTKKEFYLFDNVLILTFIIGLFLPLFFTHNQKISPIEKRKLVDFPELKWDTKGITKFPVQFEAFFNDHFGFRDQLVQTYSLFSLILKSSSSSRVLIGEDNWLFYTDPIDGNSLEDYRRNDPLTPQQLRNWKIALEVRYRWIKKQGTQYLFVIAPDKHSIYGEYMPSRINKVGQKSRLDQLLEYMQDSEVPILDLRESLIRAKNRGQLYYKNNTHWNDFGASVAQHEITRHFLKYYPTLSPIDYDFKEFLLTEIKGGDIADMLNLSSQMKETVTKLRKPLPLCEAKIVEKNPDNPSRSAFSTDCMPNAPKALIFRDSFFEALQPYISQYFAKTFYVWKYADFNQLEKYLEYNHPDIVIEERVERSLKNVPTLPTFQDKAYKDYLEFLDRWFLSGLSLYRLAKQHQDELIGRNQLMINPTEEGYKLLSQGDDPSFLLPEFKRDEAMLYIMKVDLKAPQDTTWQVFYNTVQQPSYNEEHSISGQLKSGDNTLYIVLDDKNLQGQIRFDPGTVMGEYVLKSLEIRAVKR
jgi:alginate O-acetyltransferase complex protein AlgJ